MKPDVISVGEPLVEFITPQMGTSIADATELRKCPAGGAAVFAAAVSKLGIASGLIGTVGNEEFGDYLITAIKSEGVNTSALTKVKNCQTGLAFTAYDKNGNRKYVYYRKDSADTCLAEKHIKKEDLTNAKVLYFPGTTLIANDSAKKAVLKAIRIVREKNALIAFDPNIRTEMMGIKKIRSIYDELWAFCDVVTPSEEEIILLTGENCPEKAARKLLKKGVKIVIVTLGHKGSLVVSKETCFKTRAFKTKTLDPTGAGDTFIAAFVVGLLENDGLDNLKRTAKFANAAASITTRNIGHISYALPSREQIDELLSNQTDKHSHKTRA